MLNSSLDHLDTRRQTFTPEVIDALVRDFYGRIQADAKLGPVFAARIHDWEPHLARMGLFWRGILRGEGGFSASPKGAPPVLHARLHEADASHFEHWLALFEQTARDHLPEDAVRYWLRRAGRMAQVLSGHLAHPYVAPPPTDAHA